MAQPDKVVGIIGGMGPGATVDFMSRIIKATPAESDQDHICMVVENNPHVPSRQRAMNGEGESPGPVLAAMASRLEAAGADFLVMPCNTAHAWQSDIVAASNIPFVSIIEESVTVALQSAGEEGAVGLLTTPGCFEAGLYQHALMRAGGELIAQTTDELLETMSLIDQIKGGNRSERISFNLRALANQLLDRGARVLIAACTELPLVLDDSMFDVAFVSSTDALAKKTVALALARK